MYNMQCNTSTDANDLGIQSGVTYKKYTYILA